jgi:HD-like signal output (HDOD) protein
MTTHKVMALMGSDRSNIADVAKVIATDPALAAAVLRVANSAVFGMGTVDRLDAAIMRIGFRGLRELAGAMSLLAAFRSQAELQLQLHDLSVMSGSIANRLAKEFGNVVAATAFTCGLLSEIGAMACLAVDGKQYLPIWTETARSPMERLARERERYSVSSFQIGRRFLQRNKLPENVSGAVGAELGTASSSLQPLEQVTLIARHAGPIVLDIAADADLERTISALGELADQVGLVGIDARALFDICVQAGTVAEHTLRETRS